MGAGRRGLCPARRLDPKTRMVLGRNEMLLQQSLMQIADAIGMPIESD